MGAQPKQNRLSIIFQTAKLDNCEKAIFTHINEHKLSERGELYRKAFKTGMVIAMIDERLIDLIPILATKDDPKKAFTAAMRATDIDLAWSTNDLVIIGYQMRFKLSADMLKVLEHDQDGWSHWKEATREDYESCQGDPSIEVRPIYSHTSTQIHQDLNVDNKRDEKTQPIEIKETKSESDQDVKNEEITPKPDNLDPKVKNNLKKLSV